MLTLMICTLQFVVFCSRMKYAVAIIGLLLLVLVVPAILARRGNNMPLALWPTANEITKSSEKLNKFHQNE